MSVRFNDDWLQFPGLKDWLMKDKDPTKAKCSKCNYTFTLSNMGVSALHSHAKGVKHVKKISAAKSSLPLSIFSRGSGSIQSSANPAPSAPQASSLAPDSSDRQTSSSTLASSDQQVSSSTAASPGLQAPPSSQAPQESSQASSTAQPILTSVQRSAVPPRAVEEAVDDPVGLSGSSPSQEKGANKSAVKTFLLNEQVTRTEILWCIQTIMKHKSGRSAGDDVNLFRLMFPDSEIASKMQLQRSKIGYSILFGLAPYFEKQLLDVLSNCERFVIGFDESLNRIAVQSQMDLNVRFWDPEKDEVTTRYLSSAFLDRVKAVNLRESFESSLKSKNLELRKIAQVSMDGPNVNLKFLKELKSSLKTNPENPVPLDIGSCGLHIVHGAFKRAIQSTGWGLSIFLRSLYNFFKNYPVRRNLYAEFSGVPKKDWNSVLVFPLSFCGIRWLENDPVAERAIEMVPYLTKMIEGYQKSETETEPACASYLKIKHAVSDPLIAAKLAFFRSLALEVREFLVDFQTDAPMAPFLYREFGNIVRTVMKRFVKSEVVTSASRVSDINLKITANLLDVKSVDLGYSVRRELRYANDKNKTGISSLKILEFRKSVQTAFMEFVKKILERSPLIYKLTKAISVFDPVVVVAAAATDPATLDSRLKLLLTMLEEKSWISGEEAEKADRQFQDLLKQPGVEAALNAYSRANQRIDQFWRDLLLRHRDHSAVEKVMKIVMILSHGNANLERGFSINGECLVENMKNETLISQRRVYIRLSYE